MTWRDEIFQSIPPAYYSKVEEIIETEIIEKMIADIPNGSLSMTTQSASFLDNLKQKLRDKWL